MKLKDLAHNQKNPRTITDAKLAQLKKALLKFGDLSGIVFNRKYKQLVGGHQRTKHFDGDTDIVYTKKFTRPTKTGTVAEGYVELNGERFTYREVEWDRPTELAANIAANKGAGEWDLPELGAMLKELSHFDLDFDMDLTMHDADELQEFEGITVKEHTRTGATGVDEDDVPEPKVARAKTGDIYRLGSHRLMCGDSTKDKDVSRLMKGAKAEMVFTDPPYNQETSGGKEGPLGKSLRKQAAEIEHLCDFEPEEFLKILSSVFEKGKMNSIVFCNKDLVVNYLTWARENGYAYNILVWKKPNAIPIGSSYRPDIEYLLTFRKSAIWNGAIESVSYSKVLEFSRVPEKVHPTMKPVEMIENQLQICSNAQSVVADLFGGSGSTLIACEKTNRNCYMMEVDPKYVDVIIDRWENYTGRKAKLVNHAKHLISKKPVKQAEKQADV